MRVCGGEGCDGTCERQVVRVCVSCEVCVGAGCEGV